MTPKAVAQGVSRLPRKGRLHSSPAQQSRAPCTPGRPRHSRETHCHHHLHNYDNNSSPSPKHLAFVHKSPTQPSLPTPRQKNDTLNFQAVVEPSRATATAADYSMVSQLLVPGNHLVRRWSCLDPRAEPGPQ
ncbi:unnamed protein product, partial [Ectocarpus sp. 12 AP-2014]